MLRTVKWLLFGIGILTPLARAQTNLNPSMSTAAIQSAISSAAAGSTVNFAAGTYNLSSSLNLKCGVTYTGPVTQNANGLATATAILNAAGAGTSQSNGVFNVPRNCSQSTLIEYLNFSSFVTGIHVYVPNANLAVQYNDFTNIVGSTNQTAAFYAESPGGGTNTSEVLSNFTVIHNQIGDVNSCVSPTNVMTFTGSPETYEGACNGMVFQSSITNMTIENNLFFHVAEGVHINCPNFAGQTFPCEPPGGAITKNIVVRFNDFWNIHRINWEQQAQQNSGEIWEFNSSHDWVVPYFGAYGLSMACCYNGTSPPNMIASNNVVIFNVGAGSSGRYGYGMEAMGKNAIYDHELLQAAASSSNAPGMAWGCGNVTSMSNNTVQGNFGGYIVQEGSFPCGTVTTPALIGNVTGPTVSTIASATPTISPSAGTQSFPLTVTLTDAGYSSGPQPLGNTGIWYTTDGSTPTPGSGTAKRLDSGGTFVLPSPATVKAVGMWGAANQPASYATGYGFVPSAVQTATFTAGSTFNCPSFTTTADSCGVGGLIAGSGNAFKVIGSTNGATPAVSSGNVIISQAGISHFALSMVYQTLVNVQAFTTTFKFIPSGENIAFTFNDCANNGASGVRTCGGFALANFSSGASCEGGFSQSASGNPVPYNIFALMLDQQGRLAAGDGGFTYSNAQIYQQNQSPCNPSSIVGPIIPYWSTTKFSTSPVPLNSPAGTNGTTTGHTYSATLTYDGSTLTLNMFDVTAGGSCPGASCYTKIWNNVSIPSQVNSTSAYVGITGSSGGASAGNLTVTGWTYATASPTASPSSTVTAAGSPTAANPTFNPAPGTYSGTQNVTITAPGSAVICTTQGAPGLVITPIANQLGGCAVGTPYSGPVVVSTSNTLYAVAGLNGTGTSSGVVQGVYNLGPAPTLTSGFQGNGGGNPGTGINTMSVGAPATQQIAFGNYSDGSQHSLPFGSDTAVWSSSAPSVLQVTSTGLISCLAPSVGLVSSLVQSAPGGVHLSQWDWTCNSVPAATPTFSPGSQSFTGTVAVTISTTTAGATINYTTDGSTPTTSSPTYTGPITISATTTVRAIANASGFTQSAVGSATYTLLVPAATPTFNPVSGTIFGSSLSVSIADSTAGASIFYTTDGSTPTTASTLYTGAFTITTSTTVKAIATASGFTQSAVGSASYTASTNVIVAVNLAVLGNQNYVLIGGTAQFAAVFTYADSTQTTNTTVGVNDTRGNHITAWNLTSRGGTGTISSSGMFTGVTLGSVQVNSTETGAIPGSTPWFEYVSQSITNRASGVTMDGVTIP